MPKGKKRDPLIDRLDKCANGLLDKIDEEGVSQQARLDTFKEAVRWVAVKNRLGDPDAGGGDIDELRQRLRRSESTIDRGKALGGRNGAASKALARARGGIPHAEGNGGSALDAIRRKLPGADASDDDGAGDDLEC